MVYVRNDVVQYMYKYIILGDYLYAIVINREVIIENPNGISYSCDMYVMEILPDKSCMCYDVTCNTNDPGVMVSTIYHGYTCHICYIWFK